MLELRTANQAIRTFAVNATAVVDPQGNMRGALASFGDVTELRQQNGELQRALTQLEESRQVVEKHNAELRYLATHDPLTGCLNRRAFFDVLGTALESARIEKQTLCCAMIDIDHFKAVNDRFGHSTGDRVIAFVAETIRRYVSEVDFVGRYGGEEYCVVFVSRTGYENAVVLERIRAAIARDALVRFGSKLKVTVSAGLAQLMASDANPSTLIARADDALYSAKAEGRDRVVIWSAALDTATASAKLRAAPAEAAGSQQAGADLGQETGLHRTLMTTTGPLGAFRERVTHVLTLAPRHGWTTALLRIELETAGALGSRAQREILERISALLRRSDILAALLGEHVAESDARGLPSVSPLGPSELGVLLPDTSDVNAIGRVVQRIIQTIGEPLVADGHETFVACAIGISVAPMDGPDVDTLLHRAEHARRIAMTARGGERYAFFQLSMTEKLVSAMRLENGLRRALDRDEFVLLYQPQIELASGRMRGLEALLRWTDSSGTSINPQEFVPVAESCGLVVPIGDWVLEEACAQAREWQQTGGVVHRVGINISPVQIMSPGFADRVAAILQSTQVDPRLIDLEITETAFMGDLAAAAATLRQLRRLGLHISLDDFGTGYSSLSYLKQLPIDSLKIDARFIKDLHETREGAALVSAIVGMAHGLGIRVVAEGVETTDALKLLKELGCDEAQGFLISRPLPAREVLALAASKFPVGGPSADTDWRPAASG
jgi:diguanylate cyclase (GGDEF)-like protein